MSDIALVMHGASRRHHHGVCSAIMPSETRRTKPGHPWRRVFTGGARRRGMVKRTIRASNDLFHVKRVAANGRASGASGSRRCFTCNIRGSPTQTAPARGPGAACVSCRGCGELWTTEDERRSLSAERTWSTGSISRYDWDVGGLSVLVPPSVSVLLKLRLLAHPVENCGEQARNVAPIESVLTLRSGAIGARLEACTTARGSRKR